MHAFRCSRSHVLTRSTHMPIIDNATALASLAYSSVQLVHLVALPAAHFARSCSRLLLASLACCSFRSIHLLVSPDESLVMKRVQTSM